LDDLFLEESRVGRAAVDAIAGPYLFRACHAAQCVALLQHKHALAPCGQSRRGDQPVVSCADYDCVVVFVHVRFLS